MTRGKTDNKECEICGKMVSLFAYNRHVKSHSSPKKEYIKKGPSNQWTKAKETGIPYNLRDETRQKLSIGSTQSLLKRWSDPENVKRQSETMKKAVLKHPDSYTSSNRGRTKQIEKYGIKFQGKWELIYYEHCLKTGVKIERCAMRFPYEWNGTRSYNPDFYLPDTDEYVEIKGYETDIDKAKWRDFPHKLIVIKSKEIKEILATLA